MKNKTFLASVATALVFATPAAATTVTPTGTITGRIETTWLNNGGSTTFGDPIGLEQKARISGRNVYDQQTTGNYTVFWSSYAGGKVWSNNTVPSLSGVSRERDALGRYGFKGGEVWRSGRLSGSSTTADQLLTAHLNPYGTIIDMRTSGAISDHPDPKLPGVAWKNFPVNSSYAKDYRKYVTDYNTRIAFGKAITAIANSNGPVIVHCTEGKDRSGWVILVLMSILGANQRDIIEEHLRSGTDEANLMNGLDMIATKYGEDIETMSWAGMDKYVKDGLKVSDETVAKLRAKLIIEE